MVTVNPFLTFCSMPSSANQNIYCMFRIQHACNLEPTYRHQETAHRNQNCDTRTECSRGDDRMGRRVQGGGRHGAALLRPRPRLRLRAVVEALHAGPVRRRQPPRGLLRGPLLRLRLRRAHGPLRAQLPRPRRRRALQARRRARPRRLGRRVHPLLPRRRQARGAAGLLVVHHRFLAGDAQQHARRGRAAAGRHVRRVGARPRRADIGGADHRLLPAAAPGVRGEAGLRWWWRREAGRRSSFSERRRRGGRQAAARAGMAVGESSLAQGGAESQRLCGRPRGRMVVRHKQVAHRDAQHHRGLGADHVQDRGRARHVQHGPVHGAPGEDHRVRGPPDGAGHGATVRRRPGGHRRRSLRPGAPRRRPAPCHHTGSAPPIHHHVRVRQGVRPPRRRAQHRGYIWDAGVVARVDRVLHRSRLRWIVTRRLTLCLSP